MITVTALGLIAAFCTTFPFVPQVWKIFKSKNSDGISLPMYSIFTLGVSLWMVYGFVIKDVSVFLANALTFILAMSVLILTIMQRRSSS